MAPTRQRRDNPGFGALDRTMVRWSPFWRPGSRSNYLICNIDVMAFVGVMLVLLFVLMCRPVGNPRVVSVDLAKVSNPISMRGADREDAMVIGIARDNRVFFGGDVVQPTQLPDKIRASVTRGSERKVYIRADARAKYSWVADVVDEVHEAGIENIGFLVDQRTAVRSAAQ